MAETTHYVLCCFLGPGVPWSEDPPGVPFSEWCTSNLEVEPSQFDWIEEVTVGVAEQMNEFVTAQSLRPGANAYVKPERAWWRCRQSSKLSVRHIQAKPGYRDPMYHISLPPGNWANLWCAVKVESNNPLVIDPVSRADFLRSHQDKCLTLFANAGLMHHVFNSCKNFLNMVRNRFDSHPEGRAVNNDPGEVGRYLANFIPLVSRLVVEPLA
jgi:hypothetical protein